MIAKYLGRLQDSSGISIIEAILALSIFTLGIHGLAMSGLAASRSLRQGRALAAASAAAQTKLDSLAGLGWAALSTTAGADTVQGLPLTWNVSGNNPREVNVVVHRPSASAVQLDSYVTYVAK